MAIVKVKKLNLSAQLPKYMTPGSAGCDAIACLDSALVVQPLERAAISTGLAFEIPAGYEVQVRPRSGLAWKNGLTVVNAPGTIDSDYRGEVKILVINLGREAVTIQHGDRVAQLVLSVVPQMVFEEVNELSNSERLAGGFGSTGISA